ncbi:MAG: winged helix-turn-helix domain-containing protein [Chloroflexi bacterium]|nr:winged helix-turn-helix domain-containing protein [Chloroflexota bacterium]
MTFWRKNDREYQQMYEIIDQQPGIKPTKLADNLGVAPSTILRRLPSLEEAGYLLYEDEKGGLWSFHK